ncbi:hypothetical protein [Haloflavibacter putidus]|uniref:Uncharacterized protein n=1 Tax=Haloflavibacter putidus TaxID=2576776 RepID=A0A507ZS21_9FLAO|nr:hypothetical protein [Haloflavibacter putidus]TQD40169.1 hypothetical protein FKR84_02935 [Haloflavibacter putidus]
MKRLLIILALGAVTTGFAQNEDRLEKTTTVKTTTKSSKGVNVDVKQRKHKQAETLELENSDETNQSVTRKKSFSATKAMMVDGDQFTVRKDNKGYVMMKMKDGRMQEYGKIRKIDDNNAYFLIIDDKHSIGFFDDEGNFILKSYDPEADIVVSKKYRIKR